MYKIQVDILCGLFMRAIVGEIAPIEGNGHQLSAGGK